MNRALTVFRAFFKSTYEYVKFKRTYRVLTGRTLPHNYFRGEEIYTLAVLGSNHQPCSFDDKPSTIEVDLMCESVSIYWSGKKRHRLGKPAVVCINDDTSFWFQWWENGKKGRYEGFDLSELPDDEAEAKLLQAEEFVGEIRELIRLAEELASWKSTRVGSSKFGSEIAEAA